jgi:hypothetical protein
LPPETDLPAAPAFEDPGDWDLLPHALNATNAATRRASTIIFIDLVFMFLLL